jgi:hypothetical protein
MFERDQQLTAFVSNTQGGPTPPSQRQQMLRHHLRGPGLQRQVRLVRCDEFGLPRRESFSRRVSQLCTNRQGMRRRAMGT